MKRTLERLGFTMATVLVSTVGWQSAASAAPATECTGTITGGTYGSIVVPEGELCRLHNVTVTGMVTAREDSQLFIRTSAVDHVHGLKAEMVQIYSSRVRHNVHVHHGDVNTFGDDVAVEDSTIGGNIHVHHNVGTIEVARNKVAGHIQIQHNHSHLIITDNKVAKNLQVLKTTSADDKDVERNVVAGQIHCLQNAAPFDGGPNTAGKKVQGDCSAA